jgi:hypothetical protein
MQFSGLFYMPAAFTSRKEFLIQCERSLERSCSRSETDEEVLISVENVTYDN